MLYGIPKNKAVEEIICSLEFIELKNMADKLLRLCIALYDVSLSKEVFQVMTRVADAQVQLNTMLTRGLRR